QVRVAAVSRCAARMRGATAPGVGTRRNSESVGPHASKKCRPIPRWKLMLGLVSNRQLFEPKSVGGALALLRDEGPLVPLAGCTDLYVSLNFGTLKETRFLNLWGLDALRTIEVRRDLLTI